MRVKSGLRPEPTTAMTNTATAFDARAFLKSVTHKPGVYRMLDASGGVLYVGKARNLKQRLTSYFRSQAVTPHTAKTQAMVAHIQGIEVTVTHTETEALILESTLIKALKPRYNILLRDDKSYPYIFLSDKQDYPRLALHRGARRTAGRYFGPYPGALAARESLHLLQKLFQVRQCEDSFYRNRSRPCLQHQIKRCTGPCVGLISKEDYAEDVRHTTMFLEGKNHEVISELATRMEAAATQREFEQAAHYRDQIAHLKQVQEHQYVSGEKGDLDVIAALVRNGVGCVEVFFIRAGRALGNKAFFPRLPAGATAAELLAAFLPQYYLAGEASTGDAPQTIPGGIITLPAVEDADLLQQALSARSGRRVTLSSRVRGERARWLQLALTNAEQALAQQLASKGHLNARFEALRTALQLKQTPQRIECFDISHTQGEATVASCVVFDGQGPLKSAYRRFNIEGITPGDDYAAMQQALLRRYTRLAQGEGTPPDILFIDGGKGQLAEAVNVLKELQITDVTVVGVAKGEGRKPGLESLLLPNRRTPLRLAPDAPALHLIQQLRDEAHRFAITGHRQQRGKARTTSALEGIPGIGPRRRRVLLSQFGGLQGLARAGVDDLSHVPGISKQLAQKIYDVFH